MSIIDQTDWKSTAILNAERAIAAGIVWTVVMLIWPQGQSTTESLKWLYQFPVAYLFAAVPLGLIASKLHEHGVNWAGVVTGFISLLIVVGDPIVFAAHKMFPRFVPVNSFKIFNRVLVLLVDRA